VAGDTRTRGENKFCPPNVRKDVYKYSFFPWTIGDWTFFVIFYKFINNSHCRSITSSSRYWDDSSQSVILRFMLRARLKAHRVPCTIKEKPWLLYIYIVWTPSWVKIRLVLLYKIQHGLVAIPAENYLVPGDTRTRGEHKFRPPNV
jgi:hypothetical protein